MNISGRHQDKQATAVKTSAQPLFRPRIALIVTFVSCLALLIIGTQFTLPSDHTHLGQMLLVSTAAIALGGFITLLFVTIRVQTSERRATQAEDYLKAAIENVAEGFVIYDEDERLVMCNERYRQMYSDIQDSLIPGTTFSDLAQAMIDAGMTPPSVDTPSDWQKNRIQQFRSDQGEFITQYADGRWVLLRDRRLPDGGSVGIRTDITDIKNSEQALRDSERHHRDLVERAPVAIYVHRNQIILYANAMTAQMLGYESPNLLLGKNIFDLIHPDHHRLAETRMHSLQSGRSELPQVDMKFKRADGSAIYTEAQVAKIEFDGQPALESILRDITARRRTERALMESELRYRTLFELAPDAMLVHDGQHILFANAAAANMLGAPDERKLVGLEIRTILPGDADDAIFDGLTSWDELNGAPVSVSEARFKRLDQVVFDAEVVTAPTNYHGSAVYHAVIRDVTQRKQMDATMAQNAKLASLGSMAAGLAHELSQPLNIMRFAAEGGLLKMKRNKADDSLHEKNYSLIQDQAERMGTIMDSMRIFSRKDPGPITAFDITASARDIAHLLSNPFRIDGVSIDVKAPISGINVMGSPVQLEQVLLNLLKNARDSIVEHQEKTETSEPGQIEIHCNTRLGQGDAVITVSDNGGGIAPSDLRKIFDPFFTTKDVGKGTGLGLALSHEIIASMAGTLSAETTSQGARFTIALPLSETAVLSEPPSLTDIQNLEAATMSAPMTASKERHILVVEDEVEAARAMADYLTEEGFLVTTANDGYTGLEAYREFTPDIVVTDIRMPGLSGPELIQELRHLNADLPIIAVTGHLGETENISTLAGSQPVDVLKKPVSLMELSRKIGDICTT